jgi:hypothetical protein
VNYLSDAEFKGHTTPGPERYFDHVKYDVTVTNRQKKTTSVRSFQVSINGSYIMKRHSRNVFAKRRNFVSIWKPVSKHNLFDFLNFVYRNNFAYFILFGRLSLVVPGGCETLNGKEIVCQESYFSSYV